MPPVAQTGSADLFLSASPESEVAGGLTVPFSVCKIAVHENVAAAAEVWDELESLGCGSAYQARRWLQLWSTIKGSEDGVSPMIVSLHGPDGSAWGLLPFGVERRGALRIAGFLGGKDSNANLGLFRPGVVLAAAEIRRILTEAARRSAVRPDLFLLRNQPAARDGVANPLAPLFGQESPSSCHSMRLAPDFEAWLAEKLSTDTRKKLAKKRKKLEREIGAVAHLTGEEPATAARILDAFFSQKIARFRAQGIDSDFERASTRALLTQACVRAKGSEKPLVELHALQAGGRIVATYGGLLHRGRFCAMFNSFDMAEEVFRCSPGDLLLAIMVKEMSARSIETFDLGLGEARYKDTWCEFIEPMYDSLVPVSLVGRAYALQASIGLRAARAIKQNPRLWAIAKRARAKVRGNRAAGRRPGP